MRKIIPPNARLVPPGAKLVFKGIIHDVYQWEQKMYDGRYQTFEMLKRPDTVKVVAVKDGKIVILKQTQPDDDEYFYDVPGGRHDDDSEDELKAAKRELLEETGMSFHNWKLLTVRPASGKVDQLIYTFLASGFIHQVDQKLDAGEKIELKLMSLDEVKLLTRASNARYLPSEILDRVDTIDELLALPEYSHSLGA
jgi:ADP-ribose pyrophosphatase